MLTRHCCRSCAEPEITPEAPDTDTQHKNITTYRTLLKT